MICTVKRDDSILSGKAIKDLCRYNEDIKSEMPLVPSGYMTLDEFKECAVKAANKFCDKYGID